MRPTLAAFRAAGVGKPTHLKGNSRLSVCPMCQRAQTIQGFRPITEGAAQRLSMQDRPHVCGAYRHLYVSPIPTNPQMLRSSNIVSGGSSTVSGKSGHHSCSVEHHRTPVQRPRVFLRIQTQVQPMAVSHVHGPPGLSGLVPVHES